jgi:hypothetical protein
MDTGKGEKVLLSAAKEAVNMRMGYLHVIYLRFVTFYL